jgi:hypothetical protein
MEQITTQFMRMIMVIPKWFWKKVSKLACWLSNLSWKKLDKK